MFPPPPLVHVSPQQKAQNRKEGQERQHNPSLLISQQEVELPPSRDRITDTLSRTDRSFARSTCTEGDRFLQITIPAVTMFASAKSYNRTTRTIVSSYREAHPQDALE